MKAAADSAALSARAAPSSESIVDACARPEIMSPINIGIRANGGVFPTVPSCQDLENCYYRIGLPRCANLPCHPSGVVVDAHLDML